MVTAILVGFHIIAASAGLCFGAATLYLRKGFRLHRTFGNLFFLSMLSMSTSAVYLAAVYDQPINIVVGALMFYLVATGWMTVKRVEGNTGLFEIGALVMVVVIAATALAFGLEVTNGLVIHHDAKGETPAENFYKWALIAVIFAIFDVKAILNGGVSGSQRISRHLWRMCFVMLIATLSFFLGQQQVFPEFLRGSYLLTGPVVVVATVTTFWLFRVQFFDWYKKVGSRVTRLTG